MAFSNYNNIKCPTTKKRQKYTPNCTRQFSVTHKKFPHGKVKTKVAITVLATQIGWVAWHQA
jgi:hypothetical protein